MNQTSILSSSILRITLKSADGQVMIRLDLTYAEIMLLYFYVKSTMVFLNEIMKAFETSLFLKN